MVTASMSGRQIREYIEFTRTTAVYPEEIELAYLTLGLVNEIDELRYSGGRGWEKEMGDVLWYTARLADALGMVPTFVAHLLMLSAWPDSSDIPPRDLAHAAAKFAGRVKKQLRGDTGADVHVGQAYQDVLAALGGPLAGKDIGAILVANVNKLSARQTAGTLKGDGDNR